MCARTDPNTGVEGRERRLQTEGAAREKTPWLAPELHTLASEGCVCHSRVASVCQRLVRPRLRSWRGNGRLSGEGSVAVLSPCSHFGSFSYPQVGPYAGTLWGFCCYCYFLRQFFCLFWFYEENRPFWQPDSLLVNWCSDLTVYDIVSVTNKHCAHRTSWMSWRLHSTMIMMTSGKQFGLDFTSDLNVLDCE